MSFVMLRWSALAIVPWTFAAMLVAASANSTADSSKGKSSFVDQPLQVPLAPDVYERHAWLGAQTPMQEALWGVSSLSYDPGISPREDLKKSNLNWPEVNRSRKNRVGATQESKANYVIGVFAQKTLYFTPSLQEGKTFQEFASAQETQTNLRSSFQLSLQTKILSSHIVWSAKDAPNKMRVEEFANTDVLKVKRIDTADVDDRLFVRYSVNKIFAQNKFSQAQILHSIAIDSAVAVQDTYALRCFAERLYYGDQNTSMAAQAQTLLQKYVKEKNLSALCSGQSSVMATLTQGVIDDMARWASAVHTAQNVVVGQ